MTKFRKEDADELVKRLNEWEDEGWSYKLVDDYTIEIYDENNELCGTYQL